MTENFDAYIAGLGQLDDTDLYLDIDETMASREKDREKLNVKLDKGYLKRHATMKRNHDD